MNRKIAIIILSVIVLSCNTNEIKDIIFIDETIDLGTIPSSGMFSVFFKAYNPGNKAIMLERVVSDCHCTVARDYNKIIKSKDTASIEVTYHSEGLGYFEQLIEVHTNTKNSPALLFIKGRRVLKHNKE